MTVTLLSPTARVVLAGVALVLALAVVLLRRARARDGWVVLATLGAGLPVVALAAEQLVSFAVANAAPEGVTFNEWRWVLSAPWGRAGIGAGIALVVATLVLSWRGTARERTVSRRAILVALRAGACGAALILFLEPALELRHVTREPNHVAIVVDDSRSMALAETRDGPTRAARAAELIRRSAGILERWRAAHRLDFYTFSEAVLPASEAQLREGVQARGDASLVREALEHVRGRYEGNDLAAVILVSDGIATGRFGEGVTDGASQDFLTGLGAKVHTVWVGRNGLRDRSVARVHADAFAFVRTAVKIEAVVRATGFAATDVPVTLRRDGALVQQQTVRVGGRVRETRATFEIVPDRIGKYVYEVSVPIDAAETVPGNNARMFVLRVIRDKVRVLQVSGRPSWDERALRGFFKADPNVDLISFFILRTPEDLQEVPNEEMSLIPFPTEELFAHELGSFDVIVLQNFEHARYGIRPYLENIRAYVEGGGGLAMVGGDLAFTSGGYDGTPVAEALPVELLPDTGDAARLMSTDEFHPRLTDDGRRHPITQLRFDRRDNDARWASLPPLEGVNLVAGVKPKAVVLAEHPTLQTRGGRPHPVLVAGEYGQGRTVVLTTDSAWRWGFVAAGRGGDDGRAYQKFWENAVRWLIRDPELEYLHVDADQVEYAPGEAPRLRTRLVDKDYRPAKGAPVELAVHRAGGAPPPAAGAATPARGPVVVGKKLTTDDAGEAVLELATLDPGPYRVVARAAVEDRAVTAEDVFLVGSERQELEHPEAREDVLRDLAAATGGRHLGAATVLDAGLPMAPPRVVRVDRRTDVELWSRPYLFLLALALLGAEWAVRRRRGFL